MSPSALNAEDETSTFNMPPSPPLQEQAEPVFHNFMRAFHHFHPESTVDSSTGESSITVPLNRGDVILVHSIHPNGWADGTLLASGARGWLPTNYCEAYDHDAIRSLLRALTRLWDLVRTGETEDVTVFTRQDYVRSMIAGVRLFLEATGCLNRDLPLVQSHAGIRRLRKGLLGDLSLFVKVAKKLQEMVQMGYLDPDVIGDTLAELMLKAFKVVTRAVRFLDVWVEHSDLAARGPPTGNSIQLIIQKNTPTTQTHPSQAETPPPTPPSKSSSPSDGHNASIDSNASTTSDTASTVAPALATPLASQGPRRSITGLGPTFVPPPAAPVIVNGKRFSVTHRMSIVGNPAGAHSQNLVSQRLTAAQDAFLGYLGSYIGQHLQSRSSQELLRITQESVAACRKLLAVVSEVWQRDMRRSLPLQLAMDAMHDRLSELIQATKDALRQPEQAGETEVFLADDDRNLMDAATACVRSAGDCVAHTRSIIEQIGDFEFETVGLGLSDSIFSATGLNNMALMPHSQRQISVVSPHNTVHPVLTNPFAPKTTTNLHTVEATPLTPTPAAPQTTTTAAAATTTTTTTTITIPAATPATTATTPKTTTTVSRPKPQTMASTPLLPSHTPAPISVPAHSASVSSTYDHKPLPEPPKSGVPSLPAITSSPLANEGLFAPQDHRSLLPAPLAPRTHTRNAGSNGSSSSQENGTKSTKGSRSESSGTGSLADSTDTDSNGFHRGSETSAASAASTRATTPEHAHTNSSGSVTGAADAGFMSSFGSMSDMQAAITEEPEEAEAHLMQKSYIHELVYNKDGQIAGGSLPALVEQLTTCYYTPDPTFVNTFFLTFRLFTTPADFAQSLVDRFEYASENASSAKPIQLRVYNMLKGWLESHWRTDADFEALPVILNFATTRLRASLPAASRRIISLTKRIGDTQDGRVRNPITSAGKASVVLGTAVNDDPAPEPVITKGQRHVLEKAISSTAIGSASILDFDALEMARQFTLIESKVFCAIQPEELLASEWTKKKGSKAVNVRAMSTLSTDLANLVADTILQLEDAKKRAIIVKKWIKIAAKCFELQNFDSLMAIICSLNSSMVTRLKKTWDFVPNKAKAKLEELKAVVDVSKNYAALRKHLESAAAPCLPFVGLYLTDLTFVDVGNQPTRQLSTPSAGPTATMDVINFDKHIKTAKIIGQVQRFQVAYRLTPVPEMQEWMDRQIQRVRTSGGANIHNFYRRSLALEPRENSAPTPSAAAAANSQPIATPPESTDLNEGHRKESSQTGKDFFLMRKFTIGGKSSSVNSNGSGGAQTPGVEVPGAAH